MKESEVIIVNGIPENIYKKCFEKAFRYALLSLPYTYNRMGFYSVEKRIQNIIKGKLAEALFRYFCYINGMGFDFETCETGFEIPDRRDFINENTEWDLKNNYLDHIGQYWFGKYTMLPALIPDNNKYSQWKKRKMAKNKGVDKVGFVFSFMKYTSKYKGPFYHIELRKEQENYLNHLYNQVKNNDLKYTENQVFDELGKLDYGIRKYPFLVITGQASNADWDKFVKVEKGYKEYAKALLKTKIANQRAWVKDLPSFYATHFKDKKDLKLAVLKA